MVAITGQKAHKARLKRIRGAAMRAEVGKAIYVAADYLSTEAALSITNGAVSGKNHVASAPGDPPNADTHDLDRSIHTERESQLVALTVADSDHAAAMEFGTSRVAARPYMQPAAAKTRPKAQRLVQAAVRHVVKGGTL
ncbi:HK97 gp10 family phage protein [Sphingobium yanoikuyae]|uniref:HK97 gp10 family phage protein n=1 Tax=Sphingobium yanoikuyae TaxID=13690 RepID=UPI0026E9C4A7|nr:HK97 gp10 family phage protein [Sphingobium yanoikuyae]